MIGRRFRSVALTLLGLVAALTTAVGTAHRSTRQKGVISMRAFTHLTASLLLVLVPACALAIEPLSGRMICDSDGDTVWGSAVDAVGQAQIGEKGDFKFSIKGLAPSTTYTCELDCRSTPTDPLATVLTEPCTTSRSGNLTSKFSRAAAPAALPEGGCFTPQVSVLHGATLVCISGYGTVDVP